VNKDEYFLGPGRALGVTHGVPAARGRWNAWLPVGT